MSSVLETLDPEYQYETNVKLAQGLGVYDANTFPEYRAIADAVEGDLYHGDALVIAKTVKEVGLQSVGMHDKGLVERYAGLANAEIANNPWRHIGGLAIRAWDGPHFTRTNTRNQALHDQLVGQDFQVVTVPGGLNKVGTDPRHIKLTYDEHRAIAGKLSYYDGDRDEHSITAPQYLALSALRKAYGLKPLTGMTRLLHYPVSGAKYYETVAGIGVSGPMISLDRSDANMRSGYVGVRFVRSVPLRSAN